MLAVVCDASPLIYLSKLEQFQLLKLLYQPVLVPPAVWEEVAVAGQGRLESTNLRSAVADAWILVDKPTIASGRLSEFAAGLGRGEVEAILLAQERSAILITDDALGRSVAERLGLQVTGTIGVLLRAKRQGHLQSVRPLLDRLRTQTNFRISESLYKEALKAAAEASSDSGN